MREDLRAVLGARAARLPATLTPRSLYLDAIHAIASGVSYEEVKPADSVACACSKR